MRPSRERPDDLDVKNTSVRSMCVCVCVWKVLIPCNTTKTLCSLYVCVFLSVCWCVICLPSHQLHHHTNPAPVDICLQPVVMSTPSFFSDNEWNHFPLAQTSTSLLTPNYWSGPRLLNYNLLVKLFCPLLKRTERERLMEWDYGGALWSWRLLLPLDCVMFTGFLCFTAA